MRTILVLVGVLLVLRFALRPLIAIVLGKSIGMRVLAKQPDTIRLVPAGPSASSKPEAIESQAQTLMSEGFSDAGWFTVAEMPQVVLRLLAHEGEGWLSSIYEHKQAGRWLEINARFPDGSRATFHNMRSTGLAPLPGTSVTRLVGAPASAVLRAARKARETFTMTPLSVSASTVVKTFEDGYATLTAQRKAQGISRAEVVGVAVRPSLVKKDRAA